jgi:hypothetical protein
VDNRTGLGVAAATGGAPAGSPFPLRSTHRSILDNGKTSRITRGG